MKNNAKHVTLLSILLVIMLVGTSALSKESSDLAEFRIEIQPTKNGLRLIGEKGTAFKRLEFTLRNGGKQAVDEFGMRIAKEEEDTSHDGLADFEFTIKKTRKGYVLVGEKGTAWTTLTFTLNDGDKAIVDENGLIEK